MRAWNRVPLPQSHENPLKIAIYHRTNHRLTNLYVYTEPIIITVTQQQTTTIMITGLCNPSEKASFFSASLPHPGSKRAPSTNRRARERIAFFFARAAQGKRREGRAQRRGGELRRRSGGSEWETRRHCLRVARGTHARYCIYKREAKCYAMCDFYIVYGFCEGDGVLLQRIFFLCFLFLWKYEETLSGYREPMWVLSNAIICTKKILKVKLFHVLL